MTAIHVHSAQGWIRSSDISAVAGHSTKAISNSINFSHSLGSVPSSSLPRICSRNFSTRVQGQPPSGGFFKHCCQRPSFRAASAFPSPSDPPPSSPSAGAASPLSPSSPPPKVLPSAAAAVPTRPKSLRQPPAAMPPTAALRGGGGTASIEGDTSTGASLLNGGGVTIIQNPGIIDGASLLDDAAVIAPAAPAAPGVYDVGRSTNILWHETKVSTDKRHRLLGQRGCVIWMTGLSGSGKSTLAYTLEHALTDRGRVAVVLDGDNIRHGLNKNLGFSAADREENIRRVGEVAKLFADSGVITIVSFISPYSKDRAAARALVDPGEFIEVYMRVPLEVCEQRDPKGLYKKARAGIIKGFTGIDDPYEVPEAAELVMDVRASDGLERTPDAMASDLLAYLESKGFLSVKGRQL